MNGSDVIILAIESSCDDTSAAVLKNGAILSNIVAGQKVHEKYGGVVPELASRAHQQNIIPTVDTALKEAGIDKSQLNAIAFTRGPGLMGSLIVGTSFAKSFALGLGIPLVEVNHMQGHILAHFIQNEAGKYPAFPFLCLTVSGGHTQLVLVKDYFEMEILGQTIDDAAGEAFDKAAKIMGLPYPGGPLIDKYAKEGDAKKYAFPIANIPGYDFSFSGLKTSILYFLQKGLDQDPQFIEKNLPDICASYQDTIVRTLFIKLEQAAKAKGVKDITIAGGVSANSQIRADFEKLGIKNGWNTFIPPFQYCTDNAGMIAIAGYYKFLRGEFCGQDVAADARLKF